MRIVYLALVVFIVVLALGLAGAAPNIDPAPREAAPATAILELPRAGAPKIMSELRDQGPLQFCGQCTTDSNCGTGHKCCGPSSCLECLKVVTCP